MLWDPPLGGTTCIPLVLLLLLHNQHQLVVTHSLVRYSSSKTTESFKRICSRNFLSFRTQVSVWLLSRIICVSFALVFFKIIIYFVCCSCRSCCWCTCSALPPSPWCGRPRDKLHAPVQLIYFRTTHAPCSFCHLSSDVTAAWRHWQVIPSLWRALVACDVIAGCWRMPTRRNGGLWNEVSWTFLSLRQSVLLEHYVRESEEFTYCLPLPVDPVV